VGVTLGPSRCPVHDRVRKVRRRHATCDPCDWSDVGLAFEHGDPYVFPAGVAEQEHVLVTVLDHEVEGQAEVEELDLPIPPYRI